MIGLIQPTWLSCTGGRLVDIVKENSNLGSKEEKAFDFASATFLHDISSAQFVGYMVGEVMSGHELSKFITRKNGRVRDSLVAISYTTMTNQRDQSVGAVRSDVSSPFD